MCATSFTLNRGADRTIAGDSPPSRVDLVCYFGAETDVLEEQVTVLPVQLVVGSVLLAQQPLQAPVLRLQGDLGTRRLPCPASFSHGPSLGRKGASAPSSPPATAPAGVHNWQPVCSGESEIGRA